MLFADCTWTVQPVGHGLASQLQEKVEYAQVIAEFSIHDAMVVSSYRARDTDAILTTDGVIDDAGYETVWE